MDCDPSSAEARIFRLEAQLYASKMRENNLVELVREQAAQIEDLQGKVGELNMTVAGLQGDDGGESGRRGGRYTESQLRSTMKRLRLES